MKNLLKNLLLFAVIILSTSLVRGQSVEEVWQKAKVFYDEKDYQSAFPLMLKAAEMNHRGAQNQLGVMYYNGASCKVDYREALKWYKKAAEQGQRSTQYNLGSMYLQGILDFGHTSLLLQ